MNSEGQFCWRIHSCSGDFCSIQAFHWLDEIYPHKGGQSVLLKVCYFKCKSHPKSTFTEISRILFNQISEHCGPAKLTHNINHHCFGLWNTLIDLLYYGYPPPFIIFQNYSKFFPCFKVRSKSSPFLGPFLVMVKVKKAPSLSLTLFAWTSYFVLI